MGYRLAADVVVVAHYGFVVFLLAGGFLGWRWRRVLRPHVLAVAISGGLAVTGRDCPLTDLEKWLRRSAGDEPYAEGFIAHYLVEPLLDSGISPELRLGLRVLTVAVVLSAYAGVVLLRPPSAARRPSPPGPAVPATGAASRSRVPGAAAGVLTPQKTPGTNGQPTKRSMMRAKRCDSWSGGPAA